MRTCIADDEAEKTAKGVGYKTYMIQTFCPITSI